MAPEAGRQLKGKADTLSQILNRMHEVMLLLCEVVQLRFESCLSRPHDGERPTDRPTSESSAQTTSNTAVVEKAT